MHPHLIAAGAFYNVIGNAANYIARWGGTAWQPLGTGTGDWVYALFPFDTQLIVGGRFTTAGEKATAYVGEWGALQAGDINCEGFVDMVDLAILAAHRLEP